MASYRQIFVTDQRISTLPMSGTAWDNVLSDANSSAITNSTSWVLYDNNLDTDNLAYANGLVWARTGNSFYRTRAYNAVMGVIGKEDDPSAGPYYSYLPVMRNTCAYVLAADLINLPQLDPSGAATFASWLTTLKNKNVGGSSDGGPASIVHGTTHTVKNFYGVGIASRVAIEKYLDQSLTASADLVEGWLGNLAKRSANWSTSGCWDIANLSPSMGLQPVGTTTTVHGISGYAIDGCCHDDWRREVTACPSSSTAAISNYVFGVWSGVCMAVEMLRLSGYDSLNWVSQGVKRGANFIKKYADDFGLSYDGGGSSEYRTIWWMFDYFYNQGYPKTNAGGSTIKHKAGLSYPDWTHATPLSGGGGPPPSGITYAKTGLGRSARVGQGAYVATYAKRGAGMMGDPDDLL